jgi:hypothetical protein
VAPQNSLCASDSSRRAVNLPCSRPDEQTRHGSCSNCRTRFENLPPGFEAWASDCANMRRR